MLLTRTPLTLRLPRPTHLCLQPLPHVLPPPHRKTVNHLYQPPTSTTLRTPFQQHYPAPGYSWSSSPFDLALLLIVPHRNGINTKPTDSTLHLPPPPTSLTPCSSPLFHPPATIPP